ncbi:hypothetical protein SAXI111661_02840 [Saccharomonospora xinjiangensis]|uniref:hypothetical protein n=1 Tax=Saccharomonospora xinjiangensis TaxID=75294 RepID=UPI00106F6E56|nr:hypothetical protein [Saccharomonospora xinjiangensis]QBQ59900.1 hypothetical protein EYD13_07680 [Saccharomonospora xinjiangensis]
MTGKRRTIDIALRVAGQWWMSFHDSEGLPSTDVPDQPQDSGFHDPRRVREGRPADGCEPTRHLKREAAPGVRVLSEPGVGSGELIEL